MAGKPVRRAREEAEGRGKRRGNPRDVATRRRAVKRADEVGSAAAAKEFGVSPATIRSWRARLADASVSSSPSEPVVAAQGPTGDPVVDAEKRAADAWAVAARALEVASVALGEGDARAARELATVVGILVDKGMKIEEAVARLKERKEELHERIVAALTFRVIGILRELGLSEHDPPVVAATKVWLNGPMPADVEYPAWVGELSRSEMVAPAPSHLPSVRRSPPREGVREGGALALAPAPTPEDDVDDDDEAIDGEIVEEAQVVETEPAPVKPPPPDPSLFEPKMAPYVEPSSRRRVKPAGEGQAGRW